MAPQELTSIRTNGNAMLPSEATTLAEAISQLLKVLELEQALGLAMNYLVQLQNAVEAADRAVSAERWARAGCEFEGE